jgi:hypothetical protein
VLLLIAKRPVCAPVWAQVILLPAASSNSAENCAPGRLRATDHLVRRANSRYRKFLKSITCSVRQPAFQSSHGTILVTSGALRAPQKGAPQVVPN